MAGKMGDMMRALAAWETFKKNHPKFPEFMKALNRAGVREGTVIDVSVTTPEGKKIETNLKVQETDLEFLKYLREYSIR